MTLNFSDCQNIILFVFSKPTFDNRTTTTTKKFLSNQKCSFDNKKMIIITKQLLLKYRKREKNSQTDFYLKLAWLNDNCICMHK